MEIKINGKPADITLEKEKTVGEVLTGLQQWLAGSGFYLSGLEIDGKNYGSLSLDNAFALSLEGLSSVDVKTSGWADLFLEALTSIISSLQLYEKANTDDRKKFALNWEGSAPALFLKDHEKNLYDLIQRTLNSAESIEPAGVTSSLPSPMSPIILLVSERIREIEDPGREMKLIHQLTEEIAKSLEDLPLDMQTGKDAKASETITLFSTFVEKLFRLLFLFKYYKTDIESIEVVSMNGSGKQNLKDYLGEFSSALKEMITAFENKDTVLVGDLAEYELAPRLRCITEALNNNNPEVKS